MIEQGEPIPGATATTFTSPSSAWAPSATAQCDAEGLFWLTVPATSEVGTEGLARRPSHAGPRRRTAPRDPPGPRRWHTPLPLWYDPPLPFPFLGLSSPLSVWRPGYGTPQGDWPSHPISGQARRSEGRVSGQFLGCKSDPRFATLLQKVGGGGGLILSREGTGSPEYTPAASPCCLEGESGPAYEVGWSVVSSLGKCDDNLAVCRCKGDGSRTKCCTSFPSRRGNAMFSV